MIAIFQVENFLQAKRFGHAFGVPLIVQNALPSRAGPRHFVVCGSNQIARISFADKFGDRTTRKDRYIVGMRLDGGEDFVGSLWRGLLILRAMLKKLRPNADRVPTPGLLYASSPRQTTQPTRRAMHKYDVHCSRKLFRVRKTDSGWRIISLKLLE